MFWLANVLNYFEKVCTLFVPRRSLYDFLVTFGAVMALIST